MRDVMELLGRADALLREADVHITQAADGDALPERRQQLLDRVLVKTTLARGYAHLAQVASGVEHTGLVEIEVDDPQPARG